MTSRRALPRADRLARPGKTKLLQGLAEPSRLALLEALRTGPRTVTELVQATGLSQPNTSNHLVVLGRVPAGLA